MATSFQRLYRGNKAEKSGDNLFVSHPEFLAMSSKKAVRMFSKLDSAHHGRTDGQTDERDGRTNRRADGRLDVTDRQTLAAKNLCLELSPSVLGPSKFPCGKGENMLPNGNHPLRAGVRSF